MKEQIEKEIVRCEELLKLYEEIPTGVFGASMIKMSINNARQVLLPGNYTTDAAKSCLKELQEIEG